MNEDETYSAEVRAFFAAAEQELEPKVRASSVGVSIISGEIDPKIAIEIGYILLLGKPLFLVVMPGTKVPDGLVRAAEAIIEGSLDGAETGQRLRSVIAKVLGDD
jgi:hypothetical protein